MIKATGIQAPHCFMEIKSTGEKLYDFTLCHKDIDGNKVETTIIIPIEGAKLLQQALNATFQ